MIILLSLSESGEEYESDSDCNWDDSDIKASLILFLFCWSIFLNYSWFVRKFLTTFFVPIPKSFALELKIYLIMLWYSIKSSFICFWRSIITLLLLVLFSEFTELVPTIISELLYIAIVLRWDFKVFRWSLTWLANLSFSESPFINTYSTF